MSLPLVLRRRRLILVILVIVFFFTLLHLWTGPTFVSYTGKIVICDLDSQIKGEMEDIFYRTLLSLKSLHLESHFLCYDSLWAALMQNKPFAWSSFIELCILNEEITQKVEEAALIRAFRREGLIISYSNSVGEYTVTEFDSERQSAAEVRVKIYPFEKDITGEKFRRIGWRHRLMPPDLCSMMHCFPSHLLDPPLPLVRFLKAQVPVPREKIEIQKYHYPDNWWKPDRTPEACSSPIKLDH